MTIDEAILNEDQARVYSEQDEIIGSWSYEECANDHRQLAEWLKELKAYRKIRRILSQNRIATDRYGEVVLWDDIKRVFKEVNTDDEGSDSE